jgi:hypothetical protein
MFHDRFGPLAGPSTKRVEPEKAFSFLAVRGHGAENARTALQIRRRYMLIGTTLDTMRVWDIGRGIELLRSLPNFRDLPLHITASGRNTSNLLVSLAMGDSIGKDIGARMPDSITLINGPKTPEEQPDYVNFDRFCSWPLIRQSLAASHPALIIEEKQSE